MLLNERQIRTLEALNVYRYLTVKQFVTLGLYKTDKGMRDKVLYRMKAHRFIKAADFGFMAGKGRLSQVHFLTKKGVIALADYHGTGTENSRYPVGAVQFSRDYFHRMQFISLHIALRQYAEFTGQRVEFFDSYFDSRGNSRQENSQLIRDTQVRLNSKTIVPDGNFRLIMKDGQTRLFTLELHKGKHTKQILRQLENHAHIIEKELLARKYKHPFDNYVLSVYDDHGTMEAVKRRFCDNAMLKEYQEHYIFNHADRVCLGFGHGWHNLENVKSGMFSDVETVGVI